MNKPRVSSSKTTQNKPDKLRTMPNNSRWQLLSGQLPKLRPRREATPASLPADRKQKRGSGTSRCKPKKKSAELVNKPHRRTLNVRRRDTGLSAYCNSSQQQARADADTAREGRAHAAENAIRAQLVAQEAERRVCEEAALAEQQRRRGVDRKAEERKEQRENHYQAALQ